MSSHKIFYRQIRTRQFIHNSWIDVFRNSKKNSSNSLKVFVITKVFLIFFQKVYLWNHKMEFWQRSRKFSFKKTEHFRSSFGEVLKNSNFFRNCCWKQISQVLQSLQLVSKTILLSQIFSKSSQVQFGWTYRNISIIIRKKFRSTQKVEKTFLTKTFSRHVECSLGKAVRNVPFPDKKLFAGTAVNFANQPSSLKCSFFSPKYSGRMQFEQIRWKFPVTI